MRQAYHTFWFFREVRRYEANCIVSEPAEVRAKFAKDAIAMLCEESSSGTMRL